MSKLALKFISGKYKGEEFVLQPNKKAIVGRSSDVEIVLMEDMVSRRHAILELREDVIHLQDRGSTNGTFVNGEKISNAQVRKGDRILIGTSIMKVIERTTGSNDDTAFNRISQSAASPSSTGGGYQDMSKATMHSSSARSMTGTISEVPLPDLIQLFSTSKKTGTLVLTRNNVIAKIHLDKGNLVFATMSDSPNLTPIKAIYRILSWNDGTFELLGPEPHISDQINMPTEHILMEGLRQLDEMRRNTNQLPPMEAILRVVIPLERRLADLEEGDLDLYQIALEGPTVQVLLNRSTLNDTDAATRLQNLISRKYIFVDEEDFI